MAEIEKTTLFFLNFVDMKCVYTNFSHELALGRNLRFYTPPANVVTMERDLEDLGRFFCPRGELTYNPFAPVWGWDKCLVNRMRLEGCEGLPDDNILDTIRNLSSRKIAVDCLHRIKRVCDFLPLEGESAYCDDIESVERLVEGRQCVLKQPYSGSGRGLISAKGGLLSKQRDWAIKTLREQGGLVVEPFYSKVSDFAMEFLVTQDVVEYEGLSLFSTSVDFSYAGNVLAPQNVLRQRLETCLGRNFVVALRDVLTGVLHDVFVGNYLGYLGVDMMLVAVDGEIFVHPCVEINVRRTMGLLSLELAKLVSPGCEGLFSIVFKGGEGELSRLVAEGCGDVFDGYGRLESGEMFLNKIDSNTHFGAMIKVVGDCR